MWPCRAGSTGRLSVAVGPIPTAGHLGMRPVSPRLPLSHLVERLGGVTEVVAVHAHLVHHA